MSQGAAVEKGLQEAIAGLEERVDAIATAIMGTEEFARTANLAANLQLRMQKGMAGHMSRQLALFNMPSREDINALAERVMTMDERLVRVEALLVELIRIGVAGTAPADGAAVDPARRNGVVRPARTRQPKARAASAAVPASTPASVKASAPVDAGTPAPGASAKQKAPARKSARKVAARPASAASDTANASGRTKSVGAKSVGAKSSGTRTAGRKATARAAVDAS